MKEREHPSQPVHATSQSLARLGRAIPAPCRCKYNRRNHSQLEESSRGSTSQSLSVPLDYLAHPSSSRRIATSQSRCRQSRNPRLPKQRHQVASRSPAERAKCDCSRHESGRIRERQRVAGNPEFFQRLRSPSPMLPVVDENSLVRLRAAKRRCATKHQPRSSVWSAYRVALLANVEAHQPRRQESRILRSTAMLPGSGAAPCSPLPPIVWLYALRLGRLREQFRNEPADEIGRPSDTVLSVRPSPLQKFVADAIVSRLNSHLLVSILNDLISFDPTQNRLPARKGFLVTQFADVRARCSVGVCADHVRSNQTTTLLRWRTPSSAAGPATQT